MAPGGYSVVLMLISAAEDTLWTPGTPGITPGVLVGLVWMGCGNEANGL